MGFRGRFGRRVCLTLFLLLAVWGTGVAHAASNGQLYAFGDNQSGELGNSTNIGTGNANPTPTPVSLSGQNGQVVQVVASGLHSLALTSSGQLYSFGYNYYGELGNSTNNGTGSANPTPTPVSLPGQTGKIIEVAGGYYHSLALTSSGQLYSFGDNQYGQLGTSTNSGTSNPNPTPTLVPLPGQTGRIIEIAAGAYHSLALTSTDQLYAFGFNRYGQLGNSTNNNSIAPNATPTRVMLPGQSGEITQIVAGFDHTLALTSAGQLYAFGENNLGQLGTTADGTTPNPTPTHVTLSGQTGQIAQIAAGSFHSVILTTTEIFAFGANQFGQVPSSLPPDPVVRVAAGYFTTLLLTVSNHLYTNGDNEEGQLGIGTHSGTTTPNPTPTLVPIPVPAGMTINAIGGGVANHTLVAVGPAPPLLLGGLSVSPHKTSSTGRRVHGRCVKQTHKNRKHARCKLKLTINFSYALSAQATVTGTLTRTTTGRKVRHRCVAQTRKNRHHKRCKVSKQIATVDNTSRAGGNTLTLGPTTLSPGVYTLTLTATSNGQSSGAHTVSLTITK